MPPQTNSDNNDKEIHHSEPSRIVDDNSSAAHPLLLADEARSAKDTLAHKNRLRVGSVISVFLLVIVLAAGIGAYLNRVKLDDWWTLRGYKPPAYVAKLASQDTMNSYTKHLFYLNRPRILNTVTAFRKYCPENKNTIVLGCYHPGQNGIFVYNVPDPTLAGVTEVTAAHEVLHSVYARLSSSERTYVDGLLENYYTHGLNDPTVKSEIQLYQQTEPHDVMDEMNSTFGTEIMNLPKPLDEYYAQFFSNRAAIVRYEQSYQGEITSRTNTVNVDDTKLSSMQSTINTLQSQLETEYAQLTQQHQQMSTMLNEGQAATYNSEVDGYNQKVGSYNAAVDTLQNDISAYNALVSQRNQVAGQLTTLDKALDTRLTVQATQ